MRASRLLAGAREGADGEDYVTHGSLHGSKARVHCWPFSVVMLKGLL